MALTLEKKTQGSATVITCRGAVVYGTESDQLREYVKEALGSAPMVVLDLANVTYVDSGGLGAIVGLYSSARAAGGDFKVARANERVRHVFRITKLMHVLENYDTVEAAVAALSSHAAA